MLSRIRKHRIKILAFAALALAAVLAWSALLWKNEIFCLLQNLSVWLREETRILNDAPLALFPLAIFILPIFALPVSPVYLVAGGREESLLLVIPVCFAGLVANMAVSYFIARRFSAFIEPRLLKRGFRVPKVPRDEHCDITFLVRMIPGNPLAVQNYLLGLAGVDFKKYMAVSVPVQLVQMTGYICFSEGILNGKVGNFMLGVSLLCVGAVIGRMVQKRLKKRNGLSKAK